MDSGQKARGASLLLLTASERTTWVGTKQKAWHSPSHTTGHRIIGQLWPERTLSGHLMIWFSRERRGNAGRQTLTQVPYVLGLK